MVCTLAITTLCGTFGGDGGSFVLVVRFFVSTIVLSSLGVNTLCVDGCIANNRTITGLVTVFTSLGLVNNMVFTMVFTLIAPPVIGGLGGRVGL